MKLFPSDFFRPFRRVGNLSSNEKIFVIEHTSLLLLIVFYAITPFEALTLGLYQSEGPMISNFFFVTYEWARPWNTTGGSITVPLTSCLIGLELAYDNR